MTPSRVFRKAASLIATRREPGLGACHAIRRVTTDRDAYLACLQILRTLYGYSAMERTDNPYWAVAFADPDEWTIPPFQVAPKGIRTISQCRILMLLFLAAMCEGMTTEKAIKTLL
jgi:hypothetical protein